MTTEYKIGEVAEAVGTTVRTIRYYEEAGLIHPLRTEGGTRLYNDSHISRLEAILHLAENGFSLDTIRVIGTTREHCASGDESSKKVTARLDHVMAEITARVRELKTLKDEISQAKSIVAQCRGCKNKPTTRGCPDCPVKTSAESIELLNLIWEEGS